MKYAFAATTLLLAAGVAPAMAQAIDGTWAGPVNQPGSATSYSMVLTIGPTEASTNYPELNCGGKLTRVGAAGEFTFFIETITRGRFDQGGRCIDGSITVAPMGNRLAWGWFGAFRDKTYVADATLDRR